jgi:hypothetical protein
LILHTLRTHTIAVATTTPEASMTDLTARNSIVFIPQAHRSADKLTELPATQKQEPDGTTSLKLLDHTTSRIDTRSHQDSLLTPNCCDTFVCPTTSLGPRARATRNFRRDALTCEHTPLNSHGSIAPGHCRIASANPVRKMMMCRTVHLLPRTMVLRADTGVPRVWRRATEGQSGDLIGERTGRSC